MNDHSVLFESLIVEQAEQLSITELTNLLSRTIEALSFVLLLNDYQIDELISKSVLLQISRLIIDRVFHIYRCDKTTQKMIAGLTLEDLITTQNGMTISRALVNVVIDQQSGQQISVGVLVHDVHLHLTRLIF